MGIFPKLNFGCFIRFCKTFLLPAQKYFSTRQLVKINILPSAEPSWPISAKNTQDVFFNKLLTF
jgi:hypothetical protein